MKTSFATVSPDRRSGLARNAMWRRRRGRAQALNGVARLNLSFDEMYTVAAPTEALRL